MVQDMSRYYIIDLRSGVIRRLLITDGPPSARQTTEHAIEEIGLTASLLEVADLMTRKECLGLNLKSVLLVALATYLLETALVHGWSWDEFEIRQLLESVRVRAGLSDLKDGRR